MNKIAIPCGYMGSGSSAITDILSELNSFINLNGDFEYILMHCPDGIFDLEDKLLLGNNVIRSDEAIYRFEKRINSLYNLKNFWPGMYKKRISADFLSITNDFIKSITDFKHEDNVYWYFQQIPDSLSMQIKCYLERFLFSKIRNNSIKPVLKYRGMRISYVERNEFYKCAQKYLFDFFKLLGIEEHNIILDQFLLPHNLFRINNYFDENLRVFVVDRDPRDVFILNKYYWLKSGVSVAYPLEVKQFCNYYRKMRQNEIQIEDDRICRIHFEDLIYNYRNSIKNICNFLDISLSEHAKKFHFFNPKISINNTQMYNKDNSYKAEAKIIEDELSEYMYNFPYQFSSEENSVF